MKKILCLALAIAMTVSSDSFYFNSTNNHGSIGLINIPSARFYEEPSGTFSIYRGNPDRKATLTMYPYNWLETSIFYSSIKGKPYGVYSQDYKDKGINFKIRLKDQDLLPAIAIGIYDVGGTGYYSSEYIVSSYSYNNFDLHMGAGWGKLNHYQLIKNPLIYLSENFKTRSSELGKGGKLNLNSFFSGQNFSLFGGLSYLLNDNFIIKMEYDPLVTPGIVGYENRNTDFSFGLNYLSDHYIFGLNFERGSTISFNLSYRDNFFIPKHKYKTNQKNSQNVYQNLIDILELNNIGVSKIEKDDQKVLLSVTQRAHEFRVVENIVDNGIRDSGLSEEVVKTYRIAGLDVIEAKKLENPTKIFENNYQGLNQNFSFNLRPFIASREDFLKVALLLEHDAEYVFSENFFFTSNLKISVLDNFDDLIYPPVDVYPEQVRSDVKKYLNNLGEKLTIGRAQFDYFKTIFQNNHILLSAGIFEEMFSGYGIEYLNYNSQRRLNWGYEIYKVYKRDYDFGFGLLDYSNVTQHLNIYYKNKNLIPFNIKYSYGEYLAGDIGSTIELSRSFSGGIEIGIFMSNTDVTYEQYGEGSFDKGVFFKIPLGKNNNLSSFKWRPLTKDPAAKLTRKNEIYNLVRTYSTVD